MFLPSRAIAAPCQPILAGRVAATPLAQALARRAFAGADLCGKQSCVEKATWAGGLLLGKAGRIRERNDGRFNQVGGFFAVLAERLAAGVAEEAVEGEVRGEGLLPEVGALSRIHVVFRIQAHSYPHNHRTHYPDEERRNKRQTSSIWVIQILYQVILFGNIAARTASVRVRFSNSQFVIVGA
jgi:hypothetical protein